MSTTCFTQIPFEVTDLILDLVCSKDGSNEDFAALSACGLTCKYLNTLVCPRLFEYVHISDEWGYGKAIKALKRLEALCDLLVASPVLGTFVRTFVIRTRLVGFPEYHGHAWILRNAHIPLILPKLTRLRSFTFQNLTGTVVWKYLSSEMSETLQNLCLIPSIEHLHLSNIRGMPTTWLGRCSGLDTVYIKYVSDDPRNDIYLGTQPYTQSRITSLDALNATSSVETLSRYTPLLYLKKLKVALHHEGDVDTTRRMLHDAQRSLEELEISSVVRSWGPLSPTLELYILKSLKRFAINSVLYVIDSHTLPEAILTILEQPAPVGNVETIHLRFEWGGSRAVADGPLAVYLINGWTKLDETLLATYPDLKNLVLEFKDENWNRKRKEESQGDGEWEAKAKMHLTEALPGLARSKSVALQLVITPSMDMYDL